MFWNQEQTSQLSSETFLLPAAIAVIFPFPSSSSYGNAVADDQDNPDSWTDFLLLLLLLRDNSFLSELQKSVKGAGACVEAAAAVAT